MIAHTILALYIGGLFGFAVAAIMMVAGDTDRERERQEKETEKPPVALCEEQKLEPIVIKTLIPRDELERVEISHRGAYIGYKIMGAVEKDLQHFVIEEFDPLRMEYIYTLKLWVKRR